MTPRLHTNPVHPRVSQATATVRFSSQAEPPTHTEPGPRRTFAPPEDIEDSVYSELRRIAAWHIRNVHGNLTLGATELVHEAVIRLLQQRETPWDDSEHLLAIAALMLRRVLASHMRSRHALKRGGRTKACRLLLEPPDESTLQEIDFLTIDTALEKLQRIDERQCRIVELRVFGGMPTSTIARYLDLSPRTVQLLWNHARLWLARELVDA